MTNKKRYSVLVPVAGAVYVTVEADDEECAIDEALERASDYLAAMSQPDWADTDLESLDAYKKIVEGNVCYVQPSRAEVEEEK